jgi:hypothetical protein
VLSTKPGNIEAPDCYAQRDKGAEEAVGGLYKIRLARFGRESGLAAVEASSEGLPTLIR